MSNCRTVIRSRGATENSGRNFRTGSSSRNLPWSKSVIKPAAVIGNEIEPSTKRIRRLGRANDRANVSSVSDAKGRRAPAAGHGLGQDVRCGVHLVPLPSGGEHRGQPSRPQTKLKEFSTVHRIGL